MGWFAGLLIFSLASLLGGLAAGEAWLIAARAVQDAGAAMAALTALSLVAVTFPEAGAEARGRGVRPGTPSARPACPGRQPARVALPDSREGASRPSARARSTASARVCVPSLAYRWEMWVLTVLCETYSSPAICRIDRLVGR
jgi:hypothetical protein